MSSSEMLSSKDVCPLKCFAFCSKAQRYAMEIKDTRETELASRRGDTLKTVNPNNFTVATYKRLMAAGASDVHFSFFENVRGKEGRVDDQYNEYQGHYSWIYVLKDECLKDVDSATDPKAPSTKDVVVEGSPVSLWGWAATR